MLVDATGSEIIVFVEKTLTDATKHEKKLKEKKQNIPNKTFSFHSKPRKNWQLFPNSHELPQLVFRRWPKKLFAISKFDH